MSLEARARWEVSQRAGGVDEIIPRLRATDFSHREGRGQQGAWRPANGLKLNRGTHVWLHAHRNLARAGGWIVIPGSVLQETPVWLARPWPGWWLIDDLVTDGPHVLRFADEQPVRPRLPFEAYPKYQRYLARVQAETAANFAPAA